MLINPQIIKTVYYYDQQQIPNILKKSGWKMEWKKQSKDSIQISHY